MDGQRFCVEPCIAIWRRVLIDDLQSKVFGHYGGGRQEEVRADQALITNQKTDLRTAGCEDRIKWSSRCVFQSEPRNAGAKHDSRVFSQSWFDSEYFCLSIGLRLTPFLLT
jgi:hypothetical protein